MFDLIAETLKNHERKEIPAAGLTLSAVLVPLYYKNEELYLLMGRRTDKVLKHKGQISFPGGASDPQDADVVATALREAREEIGLLPEDVEVLGLHDDIWTYTGFRVTPVVGQIPYPYPFKLNEDEVEELIEVPWAVFSERRGYRQERVEHDGQVQEIDFYHFEKHIIWGATARITRRLVELVEGAGRTKMEER
ncbi:MAG: CoA pyrophosphatase [Deltaproteobacteria bacterium]|nr:CoA pyrophosphatase [Deltaproteobacteria bacterium]